MRQWTTHPGALRRRTLLQAACLAAAPGAHASGTGPQDDAAAWGAFKRRFLLADGRVIDTGNGGVSHTEGQGWGLLFATAFDDMDVFDRILAWTSRTLRRPGDALHAWRYRPGAMPVDDANNATDGDLFIALALARGAALWRRPALAQQAEAIGRSILALLVHTVHGRTLLAPGVDGFTRADGLVVNPSYYAFPALDALAELVPAPAWATLRRDGVALLAEARFGAWRLPADWVLAADDGTFRPAPGFPPRYGYDAVRVPLYLAWAGIDSPVLPAVAAWWQQDARLGLPPPAWVPAWVPAWIDVNNGTIAPYAAGPGMAAAAAVATGMDDKPPPITDTMDYYTAALCLLARVAARDITARRTAAGPR